MNDVKTGVKYRLRLKNRDPSDHAETSFKLVITEYDAKRKSSRSDDEVLPRSTVVVKHRSISGEFNQFHLKDNVIWGTVTEHIPKEREEDIDGTNNVLHLTKVRNTKNDTFCSVTKPRPTE